MTKPSALFLRCSLAFGILFFAAAGLAVFFPAGGSMTPRLVAAATCLCSASAFVAFGLKQVPFWTGFKVLILANVLVYFASREGERAFESERRQAIQQEARRLEGADPKTRDGFDPFLRKQADSELFLSMGSRSLWILNILVMTFLFQARNKMQKAGSLPPDGSPS